ncbi:MAG: type II toxin-antitoxin system Phd/YefM family antitoxin [Gammaproteobacteria bacterium]|nr:type II toxin-antitoxin system Phd/YefM family antitoxin [Gammaproteobacteria bacterium]
MPKPTRKGAEEARNQLPDLLDAAERGRATIITKHGRPVAALVPLEECNAKGSQQSLIELQGSARWQARRPRAAPGAAQGALPRHPPK